MDELCKLLADKLGIVADGSISWLQTAIPQYAEMMAIKMTFFSIVSVVVFVLSTTCALALWNKNKFSEEDALQLFVFIGASAVSAVAALFVVPDAFCWHITPDAMLLKELVGTVK